MSLTVAFVILGTLGAEVAPASSDSGLVSIDITWEIVRPERASNTLEVQGQGTDDEAWEGRWHVDLVSYVKLCPCPRAFQVLD